MDASAIAEPNQHPAAYLHPATSFLYLAFSGSHPDTTDKHTSAAFKHTHTATKHINCASNNPDTAAKHIHYAINNPRPYIDKAATVNNNASAHPHLTSEHPYSWRWILHHHLHSGH